MAYATKYRLESDTIFGRKVKVDIEEDGFAGAITNLTGYGRSPVSINYNNGEFDKLIGIIDSNAEILIKGDDTLSAFEFVTINDNQFKVKIYFNNILEWVGWLDNDLLSEPFRDTDREIKLTANDGIALIKNKELSDASENQLWGNYTVKNYITYCLEKTELGLDFWSFINMYPILESGGALFDVSDRASDDDFDAFFYSSITSFTFLTGPRTFDDCYTVLSKIMESYGCSLRQSQGVWVILQTNDRIAGDLDGTGRNSSGTAIGTALNQSWVIPIGLRQDTKLKDHNALMTWEKPFKQVRMLYEFKMPPVFYRNWDLLDGTISILLSNSARSVFTISNWTNVQSTTYIGVEYDVLTSAELVRYLLQYPVVNYADAGVQPLAKTTDYYINKNDRITFSYSTREKNPGFANSQQFNYVKLVSGANTYYLDDDGKWYLNIIKSIGYFWRNAEDRRFWKDYIIESEPVPISGAIHVEFSAIGNSRTSSNEVHYKDLGFAIKNYFNEKLSVSGYENKSSQAGTIKNEYDNQMFLSNSDNIGTQGAIIKSTYGQFAGWKYYSAAKETLVSFSKYITRAYWRSVYRNYIKMEATVLNLYSSGRLLSPLNTVIFDEIPDKEFVITTMRSDLINEESEVTFIELRNTDNTDDFTELGDEMFKYLNVTQEVFNEIAEEKKPIDWKFGPIGIAVQLLKRRQRRRFNNYS